jgi:hypothetical protein
MIRTTKEQLIRTSLVAARKRRAMPWAGQPAIGPAKPVSNAAAAFCPYSWQAVEPLPQAWALRSRLPLSEPARLSLQLSSHR